MASIPVTTTFTVVDAVNDYLWVLVAPVILTTIAFTPDPVGVEVCMLGGGGGGYFTHHPVWILTGEKLFSDVCDRHPNLCPGLTCFYCRFCLYKGESGIKYPLYHVIYLNSGMGCEYYDGVCPLYHN